MKKLKLLILLITVTALLVACSASATSSTTYDENDYIEFFKETVEFTSLYPEDAISYINGVDEYSTMITEGDYIFVSLPECTWLESAQNEYELNIQAINIKGGYVEFDIEVSDILASGLLGNDFTAYSNNQLHPVLAKDDTLYFVYCSLSGQFVSRYLFSYSILDGELSLIYDFPVEKEYEIDANTYALNYTVIEDEIYFYEEDLTSTIKSYNINTGVVTAHTDKDDSIFVATGYDMYNLVSEPELYSLTGVTDNILNYSVGFSNSDETISVRLKYFDTELDSFVSVETIEDNSVYQNIMISDDYIVIYCIYGHYDDDYIGNTTNVGKFICIDRSKL